MKTIDKEQLRQALPLWLEEHGYPLHRSFRCLNPNHADHHPSMRYNPKTYTVHCFACSATYDIFHLVGEEEHLDSFPQQMQRVQERYGSQSALTPLYKKDPPKQAEDFNSLVEKGVESRTQRDFDWFATRGIPAEMVKKYHFFLKDNHAILPIFQQGVCVSLVSRSLEEAAKNRYRNSSGKMGLWGFDRIFEEPSQPIAICEGIFDGVSLELCGCPAVALCGVGSVGRFLHQLEQIQGQVQLPPFLLAGDRDEAGQRMCEELKEGISALGGCCSILELPSGCKDVNEGWLKQPEQLKEGVLQATARLLSLSLESSRQYEQESMAGCAAEFLSYLERNSRQPLLSTGFPALDSLLGGGLFGGLYVLGAPSSLGKTTLLLQLADSIAAAGRDVLFVSLEMSRWELLAKSLCRTAGVSAGFGVRELLSGGLPHKQVEALLNQYNSTAGQHLFVLVGENGLTPAQIGAKAKEHKERRGQAPVVIVDYLQILSAESPRLTDKQNTDRAVLALKGISRDLDTPVLAASSFNRDSYSRSVSMEAFKESGAVEYAADVLFGLQMSGMNKEGFDLNKAKAATPREEELVLLKNRSGIAYGVVPLRYYPAANLFEQAPILPKKENLTPPHRIGRKH